MERWEEKLQPHQDANDQVKQPRWAKCWEMWRELAQVLNRSGSPQGGVMSDVWTELNGGGFEPPAIPVAARNTNRPGPQSRPRLGPD